MAMSLMGYKTEFIQMTCLTLLASQNFTEKRLAYLGLCMLLNENSEILLLTSNIIKKDLSSNNQFIVSSALTAIGEIATPDMCRDNCMEVLKLLKSNNNYIKKKSCLALIKIMKNCPEFIDIIADNLYLIFEDQNHGVLISGLSLINEVFKYDKKYVKKYFKYSINLMNIFNNLMNNSYSIKYDINGVCDPFLQIKILETLCFFAKYNKKDNNDFLNLLASIPSNTDTSKKNTGNCILYELVRTTYSFETSSRVKNIASSILGNFLSSKDNNYKYLAMNSLIDISKIDVSSVQKHKNIILQFLNDSDIVIKRKSLDLIFIIVNTENIKQIVSESLKFMTIRNNDNFINELTTKMFYALEKYSPSLKYQIDTLLKMLCLSEDFVSEDIIWKISNLILKIKELQQYSTFKFFLSMKNNLYEGEESLFKVGLTILGELFKLIINVNAIDEEGNNILISENDIIQLIEELNNLNNLNETTKELLMNTIFKLLGKVSKENEEKLKNILIKETRSFYCEVQERANEYITFTQIANDNMQIQITKNIPIPQNEFGYEKMNEIGRDDKVRFKDIIVDEFEDEKEKKSFINLINGPSVDNYSNIISNVNINNSNVKNEDNDIPSSILSVRDIQDINESISHREKEDTVLNTIINNNNNNNLLEDFNSIFGNSNNQNNNNVNLNSQNEKMNTNNNQDDIFNLIGNINFNLDTNNTNNNNKDNNSNNNNDNNINTNNNNNDNNNNNNNDNNNNDKNINVNINNNNNQNNYINSTYNPIAQNNDMKEIYKNNEITIYSKLKSYNNIYTGAFYILNNSSNNLSNVKLNFSVKKNVIFKVISTSGSDLSPNSSLGIKKEVTIQNNDISKSIVIKMVISYNINGKEIINNTIINI